MPTLPTVVTPIFTATILLAAGVALVLLTACVVAIRSRTATPAQQRHAEILIVRLTDLIAVCLRVNRSRRGAGGRGRRRADRDRRLDRRDDDGR
jgi:hypothetical protein